MTADEKYPYGYFSQRLLLVSPGRPPLAFGSPKTNVAALAR